MVIGKPARWIKIDDTLCQYAAQVILTIVAAIILLTFGHYGITWDEELQSQYGQAVVDYYLSGFKDNHYAEIFNLYLYGGMFDGLASIIDQFTPFRVYDTRHLVNAFFGLLGLWGTWRLGRNIGGGAVGLMALILVVLTPAYYGHMFNNPKDIPFAAGVVWTIYFMSRCMADMPQPRWVPMIKLGIILGLTLGVRVGGVMVLLFWFIPMGLQAVKPFLHKPNRSNFTLSLRQLSRCGLRLVLPVCIIAYGIMLLCWPWAQQHPITNPLNALSEFKNFPHNVEVLLRGITYMSTELPWYYVPLYFAVQLPEFVLILLLASFVAMPWIWRSLTVPRRQSLVLLCLMAFAPMVYAIVRHPALYDATRHFLFAIPLISILCALVARQIFVWAIGEFHQERSRRQIALSMVAIFSLYMLPQIYIMVRLHPYEYIYANELTGGVPGAYGKFELDYWGTSFKEAAEKLQDYVAHTGGIPSGRIYRVAICGPWDSAMIYLPPDYEPVVANEPAEFFIATTRWMCQNMRPGREVIRIERMGVPLSVVKDLR
jgi:hypothetical protein